MSKLKKAAGGSSVILSIILATMALEGGYVWDKDDPGGETNMGITKEVAVQNKYTGPMKTLPKEVAVSIYYKDYIVKPGFAPLVQYNAPVVSELYDTGVNMGPYWPSKWFQETINKTCNTKLVVDGKVGNATRDAFIKCQNTYGSTKMCITFLNELDAKQKDRYAYLIRVNPVLKKYEKGWNNHRIGNVDRKLCELN